MASVGRSSTADICGRACVPAVTELEERLCSRPVLPMENMVAFWQDGMSRNRVTSASQFRCKNDGHSASDKNWSNPITLVSAILATPGNQSDRNHLLLSLQSQVARGLDQRYSGPDLLLYTGKKRVQVLMNDEGEVLIFQSEWQYGF